MCLYLLRWLCFVTFVGFHSIDLETGQVNDICLPKQVCASVCPPVDVCSSHATHAECCVGLSVCLSATVFVCCMSGWLVVCVCRARVCVLSGCHSVYVCARTRIQVCVRVCVCVCVQVCVCLCVVYNHLVMFCCSSSCRVEGLFIHMLWSHLVQQAKILNYCYVTTVSWTANYCAVLSTLLYLSSTGNTSFVHYNCQLAQAASQSWHSRILY